MRVAYTRRALRDVAQILEAIAADNLSAAKRVAACIEATVALLAEQPLLGRRREDRAEHVRAFVVRPYP
jgi:plasmid stabilization system protein ParE